jgi:hypothetical protein
MLPHPPKIPKYTHFWAHDILGSTIRTYLIMEHIYLENAQFRILHDENT